MDGKDEFRPSFVKPNPKQTQRTKGSKQRKNANQLKLTFYLMLGKTRVTKSQLPLALNLVGLEEVGTSKSEIVQFSFECLICVDSASPCSVIGSENPYLLPNQSDAKLKPITIWSSAFSRALSSLLSFYFLKFSLVLEGIFVPYY